MEDLQVRRGWLCNSRVAPNWRSFTTEQQHFKRGESDYRQIDMEINRFLIIEGNLLALAAGLLLAWRLRLAVPVRRAAGFRALPHKVLFARYASAPH